VLVAGCGIQPKRDGGGAPIVSEGPDHAPSQEYRIGPEDVLEIVVWKNADLSKIVTVRPDGMITLPLIGELRAGGLTANEVRDGIKARLERYKEVPEVSVTVADVRSYNLYILGEVRTPGRYQVKSHTTLLQALALARQIDTRPAPLMQVQEELSGAVSSWERYSVWRRISSIEFVGRDDFYDMYVPGPENYLAEGFVNHNTGVGKGREISGIILDHFRQGQKKAVWVSEKQGLIKDAQRDFSGVTGDPDLIFAQSKTAFGEDVKGNRGILFTTYSTLRSVAKLSEEEKKARVMPTPGRADQIVKWVGEDFDGVVVFDEAHAMANAQSVKGKRGATKASAQALAGIDLQKRLPKARIVYVSATGATEVFNLAYASRLGLWGEGTPFAKSEDFISKIDAAGVSAMEIVAQNMKQMGVYVARSLSFRGVKYDQLPHDLTPLQTDIYNELARAWQIVLANINAALAITNQEKDSQSKSRAKSQFWSSQQRFFNQIITAMQMPSVIDGIKADMAAGRAAILQFVNTNEAEQERQAARIAQE